MKICYFGIYDSEYSRNKILISGLRENGVEVLECQSSLKGFSKYIDLFKKHWKLRNKYEVMVVGYPGFQSVILARFLTSKPIIFDAFVSIYDSMVLDRAQVKKNSLKALYFWYLDKISMALPEVVLFDTQEHIDFVSKEFNILDNKFKRIFVGADTLTFYPRERVKNTLFKVGFYGHFIPLQGVEYIVRSAKLLENEKDIVFEIIGDGQEKKNIINLVDELGVKNINFVPNVSLSELADRMSKMDVCLGIFGSTPKAKRVIPNKVFECVSLIRPVITSDTLAIRELFNEDDLFLSQIASPESIAENILKVKSNRENAEIVAQNAYKKLNQSVSIKKLGLELKEIADSLVVN